MQWFKDDRISFLSRLVARLESTFSLNRQLSVLRSPGLALRLGRQAAD